MLAPIVRRRKALLVEHGIQVRDIGNELGISHSWVSLVINGDTTYETRNTKRIKQLVADKVNVSVAELWPDDEGQRAEESNGSNHDAIAPLNPPSPDTKVGE